MSHTVRCLARHKTALERRVALVGKAQNWNREFTLSREVVACIADRGLELNFDAYFYGDDADEET